MMNTSVLRCLPAVKGFLIATLLFIFLILVHFVTTEVLGWSDLNDTANHVIWTTKYHQVKVLLYQATTVVGLICFLVVVIKNFRHMTKQSAKPMLLCSVLLVIMLMFILNFRLNYWLLG